MKKGSRILIGLKCSKCSSRYYLTEKNKQNEQLKGSGKLELRKYCRVCRKHTAHREVGKLK